MFGVHKSDIKWLALGAAGAVVVALIIGGTYWRLYKQAHPAVEGPASLTKEQRAQIIDSTTATSAQALPAAVQKRIIESTSAPAPSAGVSAGADTSASGGLSSEERQKLIDATSAR